MSIKTIDYQRHCNGIIFIIALARWIGDHALIILELLLYFEGQMTRVTDTTQVLDI